MRPKIFQRRLLALLAAIFTVTGAFSQVTVKGVVTDQTNEPVIGATVLEKGTTNGTSTDLDGNFTLNVKSDKATLTFSYIGMEPQTIKLDGRTQLNVVLRESDATRLDEVVVIGYGTQKRSDLTGSVASLTQEQMSQSINTNADQMLQGKIAGVQVTSNSGAPGGATSIRIRGASSINSSNEPLYIIDGVQMQTSGSEIGGFSWAGGSNGQTKVNPLAAIAPSDIVSIDVLKDASACAIYGAAGANGVVIVTTRRGQAGHTDVTYNGYVAWQQVAKKLNMMDLSQYATYQNQLRDAGVITEAQMDKSLLDPSILGAGTDWQDEIFRTAFMQSHQVSVSGGNDKVNYAFSGGWMDQDGIIIGSKFERFNSRFNIDASLTKWMKIGGSLAYTRTNEKITLNDGSDGVIMQAMTMQPSVPVRDFDGNWAGPTTLNGSSTWNPVALALQKNNRLLRQRIMGNFYANVKFLKYFTFQADYGFDASQNQNKAYIPRYQFGLVSNDINQMMQREDHSWFWVQKDVLTYSQTFADVHDLSVMLGFEASESKWNNTSLIKKNFTTDDIFVMTNDGEFVSNEGYKDRATTASIFGRVNYTFDNRYLLTATLRRDGSSKFGENHKWGTFPSVAVAWRISQEKFMQGSVAWLDNLKLRLGYGKVGNSNIDTYRYAAAMAAIQTPHGTAYFPNNLSNPDLKWEASEQFNAGIDFSIFNARFDVTVDFYRKQTDGLLLEVFTPSYLATNDYLTIRAPYANIGKTRNTGVDIQINARPVVTKNFEWRSSLTISHNKNEVVSLNDNSQIMYGNVDWFSEFQTATMIKVGKPMGVFYGYVTDGLFANADEIRNHATQTGGSEPYANKIDETSGVWVGDIRFKDLNDDGVINEDDQTVIGDPNPDLTYGWSNTFTFKNFELNLGLTGQFGGKILNWARYKTEGLSSIWDNQDKRVLDRAQIGLINPEGGNGIDNVYLKSEGNGTPRFSSLDGNSNCRMSDRWIEDGTYLRISNISLAYNLPDNWAHKVGMKSARIYFNVQNVYTFTKYKGYDPEIGAYNQSALYQNIDRGRYPTPRTYTIGLNLMF